MINTNLPEKQGKANNTTGRYSIIFGIISIFALPPVFVPLATIFGIVALCKRQILLGALGLIFAAIGFVSSPFLLAIFDIVPNGFETRSFHWEYIPKQQREQPRADTKREFI